jgi:hypothetical protein
MLRDQKPEEIIDIDGSNVPKMEGPSYTKILKYISKNFKNPLKHPQEVLLPSFIEGAIGFAFATADTPFLAENTPWYYHPYTISSGMVFLNFLSRSIKQDENKTNHFDFRKNIRFLLFGIMDLINRSVLTHEAGHVIGASMVYQNPSPKITLFPPLDGSTTYNQIGPTGLGKALGVDGSHALISAAGPGTEILYNVLGLTAAQVVPDDYPEIKSCLRFAMILSILRSAFYALSGEWDCEKMGQDFCYLKNESIISPIAAAFCIVGSIALFQLCLSCTSLYCQRVKAEGCHPERSEGSPTINMESREILRCAQDDKKGTQDDKEDAQPPPDLLQEGVSETTRLVR